jgi:uncharacterized protein (DUF2252 family)
VKRYVILVEGHGSPDRNYLLDLKESMPSALNPFVKHQQPQWLSESHRVASVQHWAQAIAPAFMSPVIFQGSAFVYKGLQPTQDKLALEKWNGKLKRLEQVILSMGEIIAWSHLRSSGRSGSAISNELIQFGSRDDWQAALLTYATDYAKKIESDWKIYSSRYDKAGNTWF